MYVGKGALSSASMSAGSQGRDTLVPAQDVFVRVVSAKSKIRKRKALQGMSEPKTGRTVHVFVIYWAPALRCTRTSTGQQEDVPSRWNSAASSYLCEKEFGLTLVRRLLFNHNQKVAVGQLFASLIIIDMFQLN